MLDGGGILLVFRAVYMKKSEKADCVA